MLLCHPSCIIHCSSIPHSALPIRLRPHGCSGRFEPPRPPHRPRSGTTPGPRSSPAVRRPPAALPRVQGQGGYHPSRSHEGHRRPVWGTCDGGILLAASSHDRGAIGSLVAGLDRSGGGACPHHEPFPAGKRCMASPGRLYCLLSRTEFIMKGSCWKKS